jgi:hypothetical protein
MVSICRSSIVIGAVGVVVIVLAIVVRFVVVPIATRLPGDTDLTAHYSGTASLLDGAALQSGDLSHAVAADVPMTVERRVRVLSTHGASAIVEDGLTIHAGGQDLVSAHTFALDRTSMKGVTAPGAIAVEPSTGALSSAFPIGPKADDSYTYYDPTTRSIVPITFAGHDHRGGRAVNVYDISATGAVTDPGLLGLLPQALPKTLLPSLAEILPAGVAARFTPAIVAALPDPVPVAYTATTDIVAYVDEQTGVAIDHSIAQRIFVGVTLDSQPVSLLPVLAFDFHMTPESVRDLADKATSAGRLLTVAEVVVPIALAVIGLILILVAVLRRRKLPEQMPPAPAESSGSGDGTELAAGTATVAG